MTTTANVSPPMKHVFVDFENVHHVDTALLETRAVSLTILMGAKQTKLDAALVEKLIAHAAAIQLVRLTSSDKNAVDFALTYYLGRAVLANPTAYFHIVSKDTGYDPLIEHLKNHHVRVSRHVDYTTLTFSASPKIAPADPTPAKPSTPSAVPKSALAGADEQLNIFLERLRKHPNNRPKKKKTLLSHLKASLAKDGSEVEAARLLEKLIKAERIKIDDKEGVTYNVKK